MVYSTILHAHMSVFMQEHMLFNHCLQAAKSLPPQNLTQLGSLPTPPKAYELRMWKEGIHLIYVWISMDGIPLQTSLAIYNYALRLVLEKYQEQVKRREGMRNC